jgi:phosphoenolpyruvate-protein phosphotransferase
MRKLSGIGASPGIAVGPAYLFESSALALPVEEQDGEHDPDVEWAQFEAAVEAARGDLLQIQAEAARALGEEEAAIFHAQSLVLDDPDLVREIRDALYEQQASATSAVTEVISLYKQAFLSLDDEYFRARAVDVEDVGRRLLSHLLGSARVPQAEPPSPGVVIATDLTPSDTMLLKKEYVLGFCVAQGGATSHTAILARGLGIPAVVGLGDRLCEIEVGAEIVVDGTRGEVIINPEPPEMEEYQARQAALKEMLAEASAGACDPVITKDGHRIIVVGNIGNVEDAHVARQAGAEGIGLFRTEFLFLGRDTMPDEEVQLQAYRQVLDVFEDQPVTLRTLDIGGDKVLPYLSLPPEANPFLGCRAIRLALDHPQLLKPQLRAALVAGRERTLQIMFPMIATIAEVRRAKAVLAECKAELEQEGKPIARNVEVGIMVEIPAAALVVDQLVSEVDFFSIGTNDLAQYTLAADRTNAAVAGLCDAFHPAVLRLVRMVAETAHANGKTVAVCGELAGEALAVPILVGLGVDELSVNPLTVPLVKHIVRSLSLADSQALSVAVLELESPRDVQSAVSDRFPWIRLG